METKLIKSEDGYPIELTAFYDDKERGACIQFTLPWKQNNVSMTKEEAKAFLILALSRIDKHYQP